MTTLFIIELKISATNDATTFNIDNFIKILIGIYPDVGNG